MSERPYLSETDRVMTKAPRSEPWTREPIFIINLKKFLTTMGTIQIKKVEKTVTTGKQGEARQKVKKTY